MGIRVWLGVSVSESFQLGVCGLGPTNLVVRLLALGLCFPKGPCAYILCPKVPVQGLLGYTDPWGLSGFRF